MPDLLAQLGATARRAIFGYRSGTTSPTGGDSGGALSASTTAFLYSNSSLGRRRGAGDCGGITSSGQLSGSPLFVTALNRCILDFNKAPAIVEKFVARDGMKPDWEDDYSHGAIRLLRFPNPVLKTEQALNAAIICDLKFSANCFLAKVRNLMGEVIELHWAPASQWSTVTTDADAHAGVPVSYYERTVPQLDGRKSVERWDVRDIIHIRDLKNDPNDPRLGWNDSSAFFTAIATAQQVQAWSYRIVANRAQHGGILGPDEPDVQWTPEQADKMLAQFEADAGGDNVGRVIAAATKFKFEPNTHSPRDMMIEEMNRLPAALVADWFGYPPNTFAVLATMNDGGSNAASLDEATEMAMENATMPLWSLVDAQFTPQLLSEPQFGHRRRLGTLPSGEVLYAPMPTTVQFTRDTRRVRILMPDQFRQSEADTNEWRWDGMTWNEYRVKRGRPPVPKDDPRGTMVYSQFAALSVGADSANPATPGSHMTPGGGTPQLPSGGGTPSNPDDRASARQNDSQNPAQASKAAALIALPLPEPVPNGSGAH